MCSKISLLAVSGALTLIWLTQTCQHLKTHGDDGDFSFNIISGAIRSIFREKDAGAKIIVDGANKQALIDLLGWEDFWYRVVYVNFVSVDYCFKDNPEVIAWLRLTELSEGSRIGYCSFCGKETMLRLCGGTCYGTQAYCRRKCQRKHWKEEHHQHCKRMIIANVRTANADTMVERKEDQRASEWKEMNHDLIGKFLTS